MLCMSPSPALALVQDSVPLAALPGRFLGLPPLGAEVAAPKKAIDVYQKDPSPRLVAVDSRAVVPERP